MARVILTKSWTHKMGKYHQRKHPIGTVLNVTNELGSKLLKDKIAEEYTGEYPPKGKTKTEFFNSK